MTNRKRDMYYPDWLVADMQDHYDSRYSPDWLRTDSRDS